jgi:hypothetical protein
MITTGEAIRCGNAHICGSVTEDIPDRKAINSSMFRIKGGDTAVRSGHSGHVCHVCGEVVTEASGLRFKIRTGNGWIGRLDESNIMQRAV